MLLWGHQHVKSDLSEKVTENVYENCNFALICMPSVVPSNPEPESDFPPVPFRSTSANSASVQLTAILEYQHWVTAMSDVYSSQFQLKCFRCQTQVFISESLSYPRATFSSTTFVCSLNPIRQTSIPRPYTIISLLSFHHCSSQPSQYLSVLCRAYTRLLNESIEKQRLSPEKRLSYAIENLFCLPRPWLVRIWDKKERKWLIIL